MDNFTELLYQALSSDHGVVLRVSDFALARSKLYAARRAAADSDLDCLSFQQSPSDPLELWITKKGRPNGATQGG